MKRALVVGGVASFVKEIASKKLARWGFVVERHMEMGKHRAASIPSGKVDAVLIFEDMMPSRQEVRAWQADAKNKGLPCVTLPRHEAHWLESMKRAGFEPINPNTAAAVAEIEDEAMGQQSDKVVKLPAQSPASDFMGRKEQLRRLLREMQEKDGLREVMFSPEVGMSLKRVAVEEFNEEV